MNAQDTKNVKNTKLSFVRYDNSSIDQMVVIEFQHSEELYEPYDKQKLLNALESSVTHWIETTEKGKGLWEESCYDLNVGDLLSYGIDEELKQSLQKFGIFDINVVFQLSDGHEVSYDRILANPQNA